MINSQKNTSFIQHIPCDRYLTIIWKHVTIFHSFKIKQDQALANFKYSVTMKNRVIKFEFENTSKTKQEQVLDNKEYLCYLEQSRDKFHSFTTTQGFLLVLIELRVRLSFSR